MVEKLKEKPERVAMDKIKLPLCFGMHNEKSKVCFECCICESCYYFKEK
jgi:hypothetical protein